MEKKGFRLGDLLSVTTRLMLSPTNIEGVLALCRFLVDDEDLGPAGLCREKKLCEASLRGQFPFLNTKETMHAVAELRRSLEKTRDPARKEKIANEWLAEQIAIYGDAFEVSPIEK